MKSQITENKVDADSNTSNTNNSDAVTGDVLEQAKSGIAAPGADAPEKNAIPLAKIEISTWNRRHAIQGPESAIQDLKDDIGEKGLLSPLSLVSAEDGDGYKVLAGGLRLDALRILRGPAGSLAASEYVLRTGLTERDTACLDIALGDRKLHGDLSPRDNALYVNRLHEDLNIDQLTLADRLGMTRSGVNRLMMLNKHFNNLPEGWRIDLSTSPDQARKAKPAIKLAHWNEVSGKVKDGQIAPELTAILETAHVERFTTSQLRAEIATEVGAATEGSGQQRIAALENSIRALRSAAKHLESLAPDLAATMLRDAGEAEKALEPLKQAEETKRAEGKATKAAEKARRDQETAEKAAAKAADSLMAEKAAAKAAESLKAAEQAKPTEDVVSKAA